MLRKSVAHLVNRVPTESERIIAVKLTQVNRKPSLLVNSYLPSGNGATKKVEYLTVLAQLRTLAEANSDCDIFLAGDFNMDIYKEAYVNDHRRTTLVTMANDMNLEQLVPHGKPTMCAHNGKDSSVIDLLFASDKTKCSQVKVGDKVPWNTSCHNPITFNLLYKKPTKHHTNPRPQRTMRIIKGTKDHAVYNAVLDSYLASFNTKLMHPHSAAEIIVLAIRAATIQASDVRMSSHTTRKTTYPATVLDAMKKSRRLHADWKDAGRPAMPHPTAVARHATSRSVRSALRTLNAQKRERKYRLIMDSSHGDQRLFHSLVKEHKAREQAVDAMLIDGKMSSDPDTLREGWAQFYESLATPGNNPDLIPSTLENTKFKVAERTKIYNPAHAHTKVKPDDVITAIKSLNKGKAADMEGL